MAGMLWENGKWIPNWAWEKNEKFLHWLQHTKIKFPVPSHMVGEIVKYKQYGEVNPVFGEITHVKLIFDHKVDIKLSEEENITYDVFWGGHSRWIKLNQILE